MQGFLTDYTKISVGLAYASGTADRTGAVLDMKGWDGVLMIASFSAIEAGGTNSIKAQQDSASNMGTAADLEGTKQVVADDDDDEIVYLDIYQPRERYVRAYVDKDTSHACAESVLYIQYKGAVNPTAAMGTGVNGEQHASPAEGTA